MNRYWVNITKKKELKNRFLWCLVFGCEFLLTFLKITFTLIIVVIGVIIFVLGGCIIVIIIALAKPPPRRVEPRARIFDVLPLMMLPLFSRF